MRIYLPSTFTGLAALLDQGEVGGAPLRAYAVTPHLSGGDRPADDEELEYEALRGAARASLRLLAADPGAPRRRAVIAAEIPDAAVSADPAPGDPAAVSVAGTVPLKRVAALHVDAPEAADAVAAAVADPGAGHDEDEELLWYATQELPDLLGRR
ncbi:DUF6912 family protein [Streptomonospora nanhaiensis]|uniref:Uncharacterized protein n=1 Tax=Streptomonospora nanhaiensis TaxID=1323731 RepID=A0A853BN75_9ACTN|nr:hypothetical protein [Streptomonospora nanhaiensis]MBV2362115.1 hypothetical protein [Streptomonospora nanhaiensis]MBV2364813.1 hypothetical protein [Streptomonospora nanhaiensis]MBX9388568.1 hypothetical protein [Streptomonospora nanhaiensis]NYI96056.1 hypothetical protein [Streptomonospora nanhaiensis]